ncbi:MAG: epsF 1 [Clostridiaceae bacterium]|nr:epsF 1 [Clostridiaceae bacterium]
MIRGQYTGEDISNLRKILRDNEYYLAKYKSINHGISKGKKASGKEVCFFCSNLSIMLKSGISILSAVNFCASESNNKSMKNVLNSISIDLSGGKSFYDCIKARNGYFPAFMIEMINVGENSGNLDRVLEKLIIYYSTENEFKQKLINAMLYPAMVCILGFFILLFVMKSIVPQLLSTINDLGGEIPPVTKKLINILSLLDKAGIPFLIVCIFLFILFKFIHKNENLTLLKHKLILKIPVLKNLIEKIILNKFCITLNMLLNSGLEIISSLYIVKNVMGNKVFEKSIDECIINLKHGESFHYAISHSRFNNKLLLNLILVGEETGSLDESFKRAAHIISAQIKEKLNLFSTILQPILLITVAAVIGTVIFSIMAPMFSIMDKI